MTQDQKMRELTESLGLLLEAQQENYIAKQQQDERAACQALARQALLSAIASYLEKLGGDYPRA